jgi:Tfp pilus assembly protein PilV
MNTGRPPSRPSARAFTILEVMVAATVLLFGIVSAITALQQGLQAVDTARNLTLASQLMQTEIEQLRLKNWSQLQALQDSGQTSVALDGGAATARFTCTRVISDLKADMKTITVTTTWNGYDGRPHSARLVTRYSKSGLNDYFYTTH